MRKCRCKLTIVPTAIDPDCQFHGISAANSLLDEQPAPKHSDREAVWDLVIQDMNDRNAQGTAKYGTPLQSFNGRNAIWDAYQEALDLCVYLRQTIEESKTSQKERL